MNESIMYCVSCSKMLPISEGFSLYKTGFYKDKVPAGVCKECQIVILEGGSQLVKH
ncbi:hypothetical protein JCM10914A_09800 [Paenibacillus sp. JCM 10914]|uniref:hypothetical protein n=1 Tax=Paenibacillus sp. JCM 10914 TaxID=1236974 RepID=UPI0003CC889D|nr:hypothetical protein [Paenibacillus sp. JCM 10914]GAE07332.1 hypothetical protein JCM10914_3555 [Paenibacillus sp. JCM 10914]